MDKKIRVVLAKVGLDGHDRGVKVIARAMRDAGFEVIYTGLRQTPEMVVEAAIQEDVDAIGISSLAGAHMTIFSRVVKLLKEKGAGHILVFGGGIIPKDEEEELYRLGVGKLFGPGTTTEETVDYLRQAAGQKAMA
jgi:methylmalonyl-CoA mutase C-terminal domain/subunit